MPVDPCNPNKTLLSIARESASKFDPEEGEVFARWLRILKGNDIPFVVAGAFAVHAYTGIWRDTKDLDIFLEARYVAAALEVLTKEGFRTEVSAAHWIAKVHQEPYLMDLIFAIGNGRLRVTESWVTQGIPSEIAGVDVKIIPLEELITSKLYVATRDRFDGADIVHLIRCAKGNLDWARIVSELGDNGDLLLWQLILFDFVYPGHSDYLPKDLMVQLFDELRERWSKPQNSKTFRGILLDQFSFVVDIMDWGYEDLRNLSPLVDRSGRLK